MPKLVKAEWASTAYRENDAHVSIVRELGAYHWLCPTCCPLVMRPDTGQLREQYGNSVLHWSRVFEWPWSVLNGDLDPGVSVLDAGGGHGVLQYALARRCKKVINYDASADSLQAVTRLSKALGISNLFPVNGDLLEMDYAPGTFDRVFCVSVLEHVPRWREILDKLFRICKPGGVVIVTLDANECEAEEGGEFCVSVKDAVGLVHESNTVDLKGGPILGNDMPGGARLRCLCLKYEVEA